MPKQQIANNNHLSIASQLLDSLHPPKNTHALELTHDDAIMQDEPTSDSSEHNNSLLFFDEKQVSKGNQLQERNALATLKHKEDKSSATVWTTPQRKNQRKVAKQLTMYDMIKKKNQKRPRSPTLVESQQQQQECISSAKRPRLETKPFQKQRIPMTIASLAEECPASPQCIEINSSFHEDVKQASDLDLTLSLSPNTPPVHSQQAIEIYNLISDSTIVEEEEQQQPQDANVGASQLLNIIQHDDTENEQIQHQQQQYKEPAASLKIPTIVPSQYTPLEDMKQQCHHIDAMENEEAHNTERSPQQNFSQVHRKLFTDVPDNTQNGLVLGSIRSDFLQHSEHTPSSELEQQRAFAKVYGESMLHNQHNCEKSEHVHIEEQVQEQEEQAPTCNNTIEQQETTLQPKEAPKTPSKKTPSKKRTPAKKQHSSPHKRRNSDLEIPEKCGLCRRLLDNENDIIGPFTSQQLEFAFYVHRLCALWSAEVYQDAGRWKGVTKAIERGQKIVIIFATYFFQKCQICKRLGATLGCACSRCNKSFHYPCLKQKCDQEDLSLFVPEKFLVYCPDHVKHK